MTFTNLFCRHGWVTTQPDRHEAFAARQAVAVSVVEPGESVLSSDRLWPEEVIVVEPRLVICTIGTLGQWMHTHDSRVSAHGRFFPDLDSARMFCEHYPLDQRNFLVDLRDGCVQRPEPLPIPNEYAGGAYLVMDARLDSWASTSLEWHTKADHSRKSLTKYAGITGGCLARIALEVSDEEEIGRLVGVVLYATGQTGRMRWPLFPWPASLPPSHC